MDTKVPTNIKTASSNFDGDKESKTKCKQMDGKKCVKLGTIGVLPYLDATLALVGNVVTFGMQAWCIRHKGSVFVGTFKPLSILVAMLYIAAFLGFIFLRDDGEEGIGEKGERARVGRSAKM
ncbi:hypothetical protein Godav_017600 [Gossypium davidsonii]|uniref:WAT1-related protein n=1 Tax=Gossypium davidsonii TaxID=34287 RepID=A0A7J8QUK6_GOSDV|nr:hypothetical protein [Gossypium davidsonii]